MKTIFKSEEKKALLREWHDRFRAKLPPTESRVVATRIGDTHVLVGGPADAPALVLLHGALASSAHALAELAPLLDHFRVYAVDIVGQSVMSADARPSVKDATYGEWLREVMDGLGLSKASIVGVSWGGFVALRLAALAPERIERLVLLVPAGVVNGPAWKGFTRIAWPLMRYRMKPTAERRAAFVRHLLTTTDDDWAPYLGDAMLAFHTDMRIPTLARPEEFQKLRAPVMVVGADQDLSFPGGPLLSRAGALFPTLTKSELLRGSNHCPPTTDEFRRWLSARIEDFLLGNVQPTSGAGPGAASSDAAESSSAKKPELSASVRM